MCRCCFVRESSTSSHVYGCLRIKIDRYIFRINILGATDLKRPMCLCFCIIQENSAAPPPPGELLCIVIMLWASCIWHLGWKTYLFYLHPVLKDQLENSYKYKTKKLLQHTTPDFFLRKKTCIYTVLADYVYITHVWKPINFTTTYQAYLKITRYY